MLGADVRGATCGAMYCVRCYVLRGGAACDVLGADVRGCDVRC